MLCNGVNRAPRPFFIGACESCCPHSRATLGTERSVPNHGLENIFSCQQWNDKQSLLLQEPTHIKHTKSYSDEKEFEQKVIHSKRRFIKNVLTVNEVYTASGKFIFKQGRKWRVRSLIILSNSI